MPSTLIHCALNSNPKISNYSNWSIAISYCALLIAGKAVVVVSESLFVDTVVA